MKSEWNEILKVLTINSLSGFWGGIVRAMTSERKISSKEILKQGLIGGICSLFLAPIIYYIFVDNALVNDLDTIIEFHLTMVTGFVTGFAGKNAVIFISKKIFKKKNDDQ